MTGRSPAFELEKPPRRCLPRGAVQAPTSLARALSLSQSPARRALPSSRRPLTPSTVDLGRFRPRGRGVPRLHGAREQQIGCCHVCSGNSWKWQGECSCGGASARRAAPGPLSLRTSPRPLSCFLSGRESVREAPGAPVSSAIDHVTAWIPRTTPEPTPPLPASPRQRHRQSQRQERETDSVREAGPVASVYILDEQAPERSPAEQAAVASVYILDEQASKRSPAEQAAVDLAEDLQQRIDAEAEEQSGSAQQHAAAKKEQGEQGRPGGEGQPAPPPQQQVRSRKLTVAFSQSSCILMTYRVVGTRCCRLATKRGKIARIG